MSVPRVDNSRTICTLGLHCSNGVAAKTIAHVVIQSEAWESPKKERKLFGRLSKTALVLAISTAQIICAVSSNTDKDSSRKSAKLAAWWRGCGTNIIWIIQHKTARRSPFYNFKYSATAAKSQFHLRKAQISLRRKAQFHARFARISCI